MDEDGITLEEEVEQTIKNIIAKDDDTKKRLSRTFTIKNLHKADTISTLKKKQSKYRQRKETVRRRTITNKGASKKSMPATVVEDDESDSKASPALSFSVTGTQSKMEPDGDEFSDVRKVGNTKLLQYMFRILNDIQVL